MEKIKMTNVQYDNKLLKKLNEALVKAFELYRDFDIETSDIETHELRPALGSDDHQINFRDNNKGQNFDLFMSRYIHKPVSLLEKLNRILPLGDFKTKDSTINFLFTAPRPKSDGFSSQERGWNYPCEEDEAYYFSLSDEIVINKKGGLEHKIAIFPHHHLYGNYLFDHYNTASLQEFIDRLVEYKTNLKSGIIFYMIPELGENEDFSRPTFELTSYLETMLDLPKTISNAIGNKTVRSRRKEKKNEKEQRELAEIQTLGETLGELSSKY